MSEWISVKDRLPENEKDVLVTVERKAYCGPKMYFRSVVRAFYTDGNHNTEESGHTWKTDDIDMEYDEENDAFKIPGGWWEYARDEYLSFFGYEEEFSAVSDFVTHWMPLPESAKAEEYHKPEEDAVKPQTNADRIRADNEALARKLTDCTYRNNIAFDRPTWADPHGNAILHRQDAVHAWLDWLQRPATEV